LRGDGVILESVKPWQWHDMISGRLDSAGWSLLMRAAL
jgi:hypothetical protein